MFRFVNMQEEHLSDVLRFRTQEDITRCLFTDLDQPSLEKQKAWFAKVQADKSCHYWVMFIDQKPVGVLFITNYEPAHKLASYGYYMGPVDKRKLGGFIPPLFYNYAFGPLGLNKLWFEVFSWNKSVLALHEFHGCRTIGVAREHVFKHGQYHDVILMEMTAGDWHKQLRWQGAIAEFEPWNR